MTRCILLAFSLLALLSSCKSAEEKEVERVVGSRIGSEVVLPEGLLYRSLADSVCAAPTQGPRVIVYINGECSACSKAFSQWKEMEEAWGEEDRVPIVYYVRTYSFDTLEWLLRQKGFDAAFYIDPKSDILYLNGISEKQPLLHTFLVDGDNRMVLVGSPIDNAQMLALYKQQIRKLMDKD